MTKLLRKVWWMIVTLCAPELIFVIAIRERQMARQVMKDLDTRKESKSLRVSGGMHEAVKRIIQQTPDWKQRLISWLRRIKAKVNPPIPKQSEMIQFDLIIDNCLEDPLDVEDNQNTFMQRGTSGELHRLNNLGANSDQPRKPWTLSHSYYANMGGIRLIVSDPQKSHQADIYCITANHLAGIDFDPAYSPIGQLNISEAEIQDKSKSDALSKFIAVIQIFWLTVMVIIRVIRRISISQLEIMSLAFAILAILIYAANWDKPQNITEPTTISLPRFSDDSVRERSIKDKIKNVFVGLLLDNFEFPNVYYHGQVKLAGIGDQISRNQGKIKAKSQSLVILKYGGRIPNDYPFNKVEHFNLLHNLSTTLVTILFGGLHLLAWNFDFPTKIELFAWRVASLTITCLPTLFITVEVIIYSLEMSSFKCNEARVGRGSRVTRLGRQYGRRI